jgi:hypothetical protein
MPDFKKISFFIRQRESYLANHHNFNCKERMKIFRKNRFGLFLFFLI